MNYYQLPENKINNMLEKEIYCWLVILFLIYWYLYYFLLIVCLLEAKYILNCRNKNLT